MPRVKLPTGVSLDYMECGAEDGMPILFIHGYNDSLRIWDRVRPRMPHHCRMIFVSQRGYGDSDKPDSGYEMTDYVSDIVAFLDVLNIESANIVGHSMGGLIAHQLAVEFPSKVTSLVLVGTAATGQGSDAVTGSEGDEISKLTDPVDLDYIRVAQTEQIMVDDVPSEFVEGMLYETSKAPARVHQQAMQGILNQNHSEQLSTVKAPTLILYGDKDIFFTLNEQDALVELIPNSTLKVYPGVGHGIHWEVPKEFVDDLVDFYSVGLQ